MLTYSHPHTHINTETKSNAAGFNSQLQQMERRTQIRMIYTQNLIDNLNEVIPLSYLNINLLQYVSVNTTNI